MIKMDYGAITVDTSIFDEKGLKLESGILKTLEQFNGKPSHLILSEIVVREVHAHLKKKAKEARASIQKSIRESKAHLSVSDQSAEAATKVLVPELDDSKVAKQRLDIFVANTGAEIIPATGRVELDEIIKRYFQAEPPFEDTGKKKNEFPDAIALMSIESWAKDHHTKVLAVAKDNDWKRFADESEYIDVVDDLAEAISKFQPHSTAIDYTNSIAKLIPNSEPTGLHSLIEQYLTDQVAEIDLYPEASSQFFYEPDYVEVRLDSFEFVCDEAGSAILQPVQGQNNSLIVEAKIHIVAEASTSFSLSVHDSIDKDYVSIGSASVSTEMEFEAEALLTFEGDFDEGIEAVELTDFELLSSPSCVDFGEIEPDWWGEEP
ncbi:DUF4935 domain-containing protein [Vibrio parahaemolyticus]|nr:DUF4935 domain-containing protein [Vibrio parahaemolyticus]EGQ8884820.1 DUF4935 domain-containing protein [Vibrio parahaemolyticus]EGQ8917343.1 DUF4935 domain-containing protein [Vibrio parahaemolyticus]EGQ8937089.1 DUF4935 domain-containing protein [Vibrio parahaemolyticus]EGR3237701.1 hypothetical protein [Vibrio parahaemolyticus]